METNMSTDFKSNVADLTKIPPNEFDKYFQEWMERDDVARSLQAKLRCDLIKNFNKTNLGKHILSHTMTSSGGSTMRLTLSPLILALNTLVAEFLYAQNCHFTLSVFCTEIPFRNTLPDFESMRRFRFNKEEISEIWRAVTGSKANKRDLNKHIIQNYETNPQMSLLLLIIKCLLKKESLEQLKRNAEVQTEIEEKSHKSVPAQVLDQERKSSSKMSVKDDSNLDYINKYLLTLSEKVIEMTREFEQFAKQRRESRTRTLKSSRSREYYTLNKSLERITENMKTMVQAKRKNKRLSNIVESIDNLTQQFGKCAQNFDHVTKFLGSKEDTTDATKAKRAKVKLKEQQTETEFPEKSYSDWINEMRNTENGQTFLNRVEISLRKALIKHQEQLKIETDIKVKHLKSLMKLHYQQKLSKHLLEEPKVKLEEARKCNDDIERKLQQFERKQMDLLQKLQESSLELKEAQLQQKLNSTQSVQEELNHEKEDIIENNMRSANIEHSFSHQYKSNHLLESEKNYVSVKNQHQDDDSQTRCNFVSIKKDITTQSPLKDLSKVQEQILDIAQNIAEHGRSVDQIIFDAKLRLQQLESESNTLEQNFQSYLERRKRCQEQDKKNQDMSKIHTFLKDLHEITTARLRPDRKKPIPFDKDEEELQRLKEKLQQIPELITENPKSAKSESSTSSLEIRNAILEAKLKFFEHENTLRKCREQEEEIHTGNLLQKQLEKYSELKQLQDYISETNVNFEPQADTQENPEVNLESSLSEINLKDKSLDEEQDINLSPMTDQKSQKSEQKTTPNIARRELFPKFSKPSEELQSYLRYHEPITLPSKNNRHNFAEQKPKTRTEGTSELIKQSMAKMQQLFEQQSKSKETLREIVNDLQQENVLQNERTCDTTGLLPRPYEVLEKSITTTITSTTTATTNTTKASEDTDMKNNPEISDSIESLKHNSHTLARSLVNLSNESEDSFDTTKPRVQVESAMIKDMKGLEITISNREDEMGQVIDSSASSELQLSSKSKSNTQREFGQIHDSPKLSDLKSPGNQNKIGEPLMETNRTFAAMEAKFYEHFSSRSSSDLEISTNHQKIDANNLGDDSESDFWA